MKQIQKSVVDVLVMDVGLHLILSLFLLTVRSMPAESFHRKSARSKRLHFLKFTIQNWPNDTGRVRLHAKAAIFRPSAGDVLPWFMAWGLTVLKPVIRFVFMWMPRTDNTPYIKTLYELPISQEKMD